MEQSGRRTRRLRLPLRLRRRIARRPSTVARWTRWTRRRVHRSLRRARPHRSTARTLGDRTRYDPPAAGLGSSMLAQIQAGVKSINFNERGVGTRLLEPGILDAYPVVPPRPVELLHERRDVRRVDLVRDEGRRARTSHHRWVKAARRVVRREGGHARLGRRRRSARHAFVFYRGLHFW